MPCDIERGERLVEQPQRTLSGEREARERRATALALREPTHAAPSRELAKRPSAARTAASSDRVARDRAGYGEILGRREVVLHRRRVARDRRARTSSLRAAARCRRPSSAHDRRSARAVRTGCAAGWSCRCRSRPRCAARSPGRNVAAISPRNRVREPRSHSSSSASSMGRYCCRPRPAGGLLQQAGSDWLCSQFCKPSWSTRPSCISSQSMCSSSDSRMSSRISRLM